MGKTIGMLVDLDFCVGCYACQSACSDHWDLPVGSSYLKVMNCKPEEVDGRLKMFLCPIPYSLDRCAQCVEFGEGASCAKICIGKALAVGEAGELAERAASLGRRTCLFR
ncbi:hypothetical protein C1878_04930 [Gordonibacter sp. 28C]|uniref:hypothetical protein n=1 Tax=Gordonibacter sp. 28C TaxID=2078569 RepID=UPI000DF7B4BD|nr:hypothetical protein [Gordonibacter sp. 28C]RDB63211.1 hypothetical protein C1878_04930 [Gordonibacter sp. 28C]